MIYYHLAFKSLHGKSNNIPFLEHLLDYLNKNSVMPHKYETS